MDLLELRSKLDCIDEQIVELYEERMEICSQVADYKIETGKKVLDRPGRKRSCERCAAWRIMSSMLMEYRNCSSRLCP